MGPGIFRVAAIAALCLLLPENANAQCNFDAAAKAKGGKFDFVRAYSSCPGVTFAAPNTSTMTGVPGCTPPTAISTYQFGHKGSCSLKTKAKLEDPCSTGDGFACSNLSVKAKCKDVQDGTGVPIEGPGWGLRVIARITLDAPSRGDMTTVDTPLEFAFNDGANGKLKLSANTNQMFGITMCIPPDCTLPGCTSVELISVAILDPSSEVFAKLGSSTR